MYAGCGGFGSVAVLVCGGFCLWQFWYVAVLVCGGSGMWRFWSCGGFGFVAVPVRYRLQSIMYNNYYYS